MDDLKESHIEFVSNLNGSSPSDIILSTIPAPISVALTSVVLPILLPVRYTSLRYSARIWIHFLIEIITVVCTLLFSLTVFSGNPFMNDIYLLLIVMSIMLSAPYLWTGSIPSMSVLLDYPLPEKKPPFLTNYRASMNLATSICILAVDFHLFPRRYAKTESYGFSLMDVGVGSFVIAHGLAGTASASSASKTFRKSLPLLILGLMRLVAVKLSDYHEHVTEYGVHWNFFFTLVFVKMISSCATFRSRPGVIAFCLIGIYEIVLKLGLESWILSDYPRNNIVSANREGIFSLFGYTALFYASSELGSYLSKPRERYIDWFRALLFLIFLAISGWIALWLSQDIFGMPSRRLVNFSFCIWMLVYNVIMMASYLLVDLTLLAFDLRTYNNCNGLRMDLPQFREPYLLRFINFNGLMFFLLANLLTGLVNLTFNTLQIGSIAAIVILFSYTTILCLSVAVLYIWRIRIG